MDYYGFAGRILKVDLTTGKIEKYHKILSFLTNTYASWSSTQLSLDNIENLNKIKEERDNDKVEEKLERLKEAAKGTENLMPFIVDAVREYASIGEIIDTLKEIFGAYHEDSIY